MTYKEKFKEVFGYNPMPDRNMCSYLLCFDKDCTGCHLNHKTWNSEYCEPPKKKSIKVGDFVKVADDGEQYSTYYDIFNKSALSKASISRFALGEHINTECEYEVLEIIQHEEEENTLIAVLTPNKRYGKLYLVGTKGLKATKVI